MRPPLSDQCRRAVEHLSRLTVMEHGVRGSEWQMTAELLGIVERHRHDVDPDPLPPLPERRRVDWRLVVVFVVCCAASLVGTTIWLQRHPPASWMACSRAASYPPALDILFRLPE